MMTTISHLRAMTLLVVMLFPTIIASSSMKLDEESVVETGSSHLRKRMTVPEERNLRPFKAVKVIKPLPVKEIPPLPTPAPVSHPPPPTQVYEVEPIKDIWMPPPTLAPVSPPPPTIPISEVKPIKDFFMPTTSAPTPLPTTPPTPAPPPLPKVITLGDSYSSGTGIHRDGNEYDVEYGGDPVLNGVTYDFTARSDQECWMEQDTTPGPKYASLMGQQSVFYGCKGALISHLNSQLDYLLAALPLDHQHNFQGSTILLTAGGNDIVTNDGMSWPDLLIECITETHWGGCDDRNGNQVANFPTIQSSLTSLYNRLAIEASGAKIRILGYPKMMQRDPGCGSVTGVSRDEADWIDDQCVLLNNRLSAAVNAAKANHPSVDIEFVSVYNYLTVGACGNGPSNRHVHDKRLHSYWPFGSSDSSFHPSQKGYDKYYDALLNSL